MTRRIAAALAALLVSLAIVAGLSRPAGQYFYCEAMGMLPFDPCAQGAHDCDHGSCSAIRSHHADCCDRITVASTPKGATASAPDVPPPAMAATLAAPVFPSARTLAPPRTPGSGPEGWGMPRPPGQEARARLMVSLT